MTPVQKLLARAAERISAPGTWCQGEGRRGKARCVVGVIHTVSRSLVMQRAAWAVLTQTAGGWPVGVNDHPDTVHGDMSTLLALAACLDESEVP